MGQVFPLMVLTIAVAELAIGLGIFLCEGDDRGEFFEVCVIYLSDSDFIVIILATILLTDRTFNASFFDPAGRSDFLGGFLCFWGSFESVEAS